MKVNLCVCSQTSCCLAQAEKQLEISTHLGSLASRWRCVAYVHHAIRPEAIRAGCASDGCEISINLKRMADQLLFIYFYLQLMNSVKFHGWEPNSLCARDGRRPNIQSWGVFSLLC